uniref:Putative equilibrative nucleoside transporter 3-like protein n=1 Tax=Ornithodoros turicata TaxID=34597 RepID=A0A2R5LCW4_9ACAR
MDHNVPTYRRHFSTTLALHSDTSSGTAGTFTSPKPYVIPADEVLGDCDEPLLTPGASVHVLPVDKGSFVKRVFFLLGIIILVPSTYLMTASDYWMYKFRNVTAGPHVNASAKTTLQTNFFAAYGVFTNLPALATISVTIMFNHRIQQRLRNMISLCTVIVIFVMLTVFVKVDTDNWQYGFFMFIMATLLVLNVFGTWLQGGIFGLASLLPQEYIHSCVIGMSVGGVLSSTLQILAIVWHPHPTNSGLVYFGCGTALLIVGLLGFLAIQHVEFFKYYLKNPAASVQDIITYEDLGVDVPVILLFRRVWQEAISILVIFCVTQCVFPAVTVLVVSKDVHSGSAWSGRLFIPVCCYFLFNAADMSGRIGSSYAPLGEGKEKLVLLLSIVRVIFIPLFLLCNTEPHAHMPVIFDDVTYIVLITAFGFSNGYLFSSAMAQAPKKMESYLQEKTGAMMTGFVIAGLAIGAMLSVVVVRLL